MTLPNLLSISRVFLLIPIIFLFEKEFYVLACIFFIVASLTDFFDGYIARKRNLESDLGGLLDLLADKLFVSILLIWFCFNLDSLLILISTILIVSREIIISYVRLFLISTSRRLSGILYLLKISKDKNSLSSENLKELNPIGLIGLSLFLI